MDKLNLVKLSPGEAVEGDKVILIAPKYAGGNSRSYNPHYLSKFFCEGSINGIFKEEGREIISVRWKKTGESNEYSPEDLSLVYEMCAPTRSMYILNQDIKVGNVTITKKGKMLISDGQYMHDKGGNIFIKISSDEGDFDFDKGKIFTKREKQKK